MFLIVGNEIQWCQLRQNATSELLDHNKSLLVISGQIGMRQDGFVPKEQSQQFSLALDNIRKNVEAQGLSVSDIIKMTFYWGGETLPAEERNLILTPWLQGHQPCMTMVTVKGLARPDLLIEIEAFAEGKIANSDNKYSARS
ncbi:Rid family hydrolase [Serratia sp. DD3]|uniref:Rid family hydrolase n=1 Tax=Serratia sp. DD3 TaxID=1410619 RepID=UPI00135F18F9|nr:Rid family hydrolase [Serratia sp. DD3]